MELKEVELRFGVQFPNLFHEIYLSGMMEYLIHPNECPFQQEQFFGNYMDDCILIAFENLPDAYADLQECFDLDLTLYPQHKSMNPNYRIIPFARKISGDKYCFLYTAEETEPKIILYGHDTGDVDLWADNFEELIYFQLVAEASSGEQSLDSDYMKAHIKWLNEEHQQLLTALPAQTLWEQLPEPEEFDIWI